MPLIGFSHSQKCAACDCECCGSQAHRQPTSSPIQIRCYFLGAGGGGGVGAGRALVGEGLVFMPLDDVPSFLITLGGGTEPLFVIFALRVIC